MRMNRIRNTLGSLLMLLAAHAAQASELDITATYKGSLTQTAGQFINTTPSSGTCSAHPEYCPAGYFGLLFPWAGNEPDGTMGTKTVAAPSSDPRDGFYFGFDASEHSLTVTSEQGKAHRLSLALDAIGWGIEPFLPVTYYFGYAPDLAYPKGDNCRNIAWPYGQPRIPLGFLFGMWGAKTHAFTECYLPFRTDSEVKEVSLKYINFRYQLKMEKPWTWEPGTYHGSYTYKIGKGKDLDFGNNFSGSADDVTLNFTLTVQPDMHVNFHADHGVINADLQPPGGWDKWQPRMPPYLSRELTFDFGSVGPVKIYLKCEHDVSGSCGIVDQQGGSPLGVDTLLSANHFNDDTGKEAIQSRLSTTGRIFTPRVEGHPRVHPAKLLFKTQKDVGQQLQSGHQYGGLVTVVFDSDVGG